jgi:hypothetical protein
MEINVKCTTCSKDIIINEWWYNYRLKRNNGRGIFCSKECGQLGKKPTQETRNKLTTALKKSYNEGTRNLSPTITVECSQCNKPLTMKQWEYNHRINRNKRKEIFCSIKCSLTGVKFTEERKEKIGNSQIDKSCPQRGRKNKTLSEEHKKKISETRKRLYQEQGHDPPIVVLICKNEKCKKKFQQLRWIYNRRVKEYGDGMYCSQECYHESRIGKETPEDVKMKISESLTGKSKPHIGIPRSEETRLKISQSKRGIPVKCDWDIVISDAHERGLESYVITRKPVPDIIYAENNQLVAIEIEKKILESDAKIKMRSYENMNGYNKVIIVWYSRGIKRKEWIKTKTDPNWKEIVF